MSSNDPVTRRDVLKILGGGIVGLGALGIGREAYDELKEVPVAFKFDYDDFPIEGGCTVYSIEPQTDYSEDVGIVGQRHKTSVPEKGSYGIEIRDDGEKWVRDFDVEEDWQWFRFELE